MSEHPLFDTVDPLALQRASASIALAFMAGAKPTLTALANDDSIPPDVFHAAIVKAHLSGAAAALLVQTGAIGDEQVTREAGDFILRSMREIRLNEREQRTHSEVSAVDDEAADVESPGGTVVVSTSVPVRKPGPDDFDNMHHALGRPADPLAVTFRNRYCIGLDTVQAARFRELADYWECERTINHGRDGVYAVTQRGREALALFMTAGGDAAKPLLAQVAKR